MRAVDPELAAIAAHLPRPSLADPVVARKRIHDLFESGRSRLDRSWQDRVDVRHCDIAGPDGNRIPLRVYTPHAGTGAGLVHFHGGAFVVGDLELSEPTACRYADEAGVTVVDVDYRLAPEQPYPAGFDDCFTALCWAVDHNEELGIDLSRLAVGGNSAGGGLAAA